MAISRIFRRSLRKEHWDLIVRNLIVALLHDEKWAMKRPAVAEGPEVKRRVFELTERRCVLMRGIWRAFHFGTGRSSHS
jgi:hypothetical protein